MLDAAVLALGVLADGDDVHVRVGRLVALDGHAWTHVGVKVKGSAQQQIHRWVPCSNWGLQRPYRKKKIHKDERENKPLHGSES